MLQKAFPEGVHEDEELEVVGRAIYDHVSDRNLATTLSFAFDKDWAWMYQVALGSASLSLDDPRVRAVIEALEPHGFSRWCEEAE